MAENVIRFIFTGNTIVASSMTAVKNFDFQLYKVRNKFYCGYSTATSVTSIKEEKIRIDKWDVNYVKVGNGPHHVLCLPGILGTIWTDFKPQIEGFDKDKFTVVVWDPPGYGKSKSPDKDFTVPYHHMDADYAFQFMSALKIPKYSLIGLSDGGVSVLIHAAKYPDATVKLIGIATHAYFSPEQVKLCKQLKDLSKWQDSKKRAMTDVYGESIAQYWSKWVDGVVSVYKADNGNFCSHLLKDIKCPTLIVYGEKDILTATSQAMHLIKNIEGARSYAYPDGKHNLHLKYVEDFNKRVQGFLLEP